MKALNKIAILFDERSRLSYELIDFQKLLLSHNIEVKIFHDNESILAYQPDCVIITEAEDAKLTPFPTYGLLTLPRHHYLSVPRLLRNILTYDGYLVSSPVLKQMLNDIMFGARKLSTSILSFNFYPQATAFITPNLNTPNRFFIFVPNIRLSPFKTAIFNLLNEFKDGHVVTLDAYTHPKYQQRIHVISDSSELNQTFQAYSVGICLESGDEYNQQLDTHPLKIISSSVPLITQQISPLINEFADNIFYIPEKTLLNELNQVIKTLLKQIYTHRDETIERTKKAHQIFLQQFALEQFYEKFIEFHQATLINKGYLPNPDPVLENKLPSVTYIMRTGGKHRPFLERALQCLVDQKYPDLRIVFVTHVKVHFLPELMQNYPTLKYKIIESIKSRRSEAIRDGMSAVETDLFGLFDDDDELFPNHVRSLVKTLNYHNKRDFRGEIGMVYSGSIHADDTYPVYERVEFQDHLLKHKNEKRAIEHFKFYSSLLMSKHAWFMPNGWLAKRTLIDEELLVDPKLDTCEDLYFELQLAQRAYFAFSVEVTAIHHFHHLGNSTIDDSHKHLPDTERIALRNFMRVFPPDALYDTEYNLIGKLSQHDYNQISYKDHTYRDNHPGYFENAFYPFRNKGHISINAPIYPNKLQKVKVALNLALKSGLHFYRFLKMSSYKKHYYYSKFKRIIKHYGYRYAFMQTARFFYRSGSRYVDKSISLLPTQKIDNISNVYYKTRVVLRYEGMMQLIKKPFKKKK